MLQLNVNSLNARAGELTDYLAKYKPGVVMLQETLMREGIVLPKILPSEYTMVAIHHCQIHCMLDQPVKGG